MANRIDPNAIGIDSIVVANTNQMRTLAASARRWSLPYQLDFRINTLLDHAGLHTLMFDAMISSDNDLELIIENRELISGTSLYLRVLCYYKVVGQTADEPFSGFLTVRFRDYIWLQTPEGSVRKEFATARAVLPRDEYSPAEPDPTMWRTTGRAGRLRPPGTFAAYRFNDQAQP